MPSKETQAHRLRGVLLVMAAVFVFACSDVVTKYLAMRYPVPLVLAIRYAVNLLLLIALFGPRFGRGLYLTKRTGMVLFRAACLVVSSLCMGLALKVMPVAEAIAIVYLAPFGVLLLAGRVLGEKPTWQGWLAAAVGFCGVLLICRPGAGLAPLGIVYAMLTAAFTTVYFLLSRSLAATETTEAMLFYVAVTGVIAFGAMLPWNWSGPAFSLLDIALLFSLGAIALAGHYFFTAAYRYAPASLLSPVNYMQLFWAGGIGWVVFGHVPDALSAFGIALVAAAGSGIALWTHCSRQRANPVITKESPVEV
jgi:drug/metabolite transporter (DMT)-like permease